jgi:rhamnulose-1-phosphate aldolase
MNSIPLNTELEKLIDDIGETGYYLWQKGWAERNAGNISVDITDLIEKRGQVFDAYPKIDRKIEEPVCSGRCFLMTSAGARMRELKKYPEERMIILYIPDELDGFHVLWGGQGTGSNPTTEFATHLKLHGQLFEKKPEYKAIIHTHPHHLFALTHIAEFNNEKAINQLLWSMHPELKIFLPDGIGLVAYQCPGTDELAEATNSALQDHRVIVWEKHGCLATGTDIADAFDLIEIADKAAQIFLLCRSAGYEVQGLSKKQLKELKDRFLEL